MYDHEGASLYESHACSPVPKITTKRILAFSQQVSAEGLELARRKRFSGNLHLMRRNKDRLAPNDLYPLLL